MCQGLPSFSWSGGFQYSIAPYNAIPSFYVADTAASEAIIYLPEKTDVGETKKY